jgi:sugar (pentulose or hexulose) kinase
VARQRGAAREHVVAGQVYTAGGGAKNPVWTEIRAAKLGVPVQPSPQAEAAYGAAVLARQPFDV